MSVSQRVTQKDDFTVHELERKRQNGTFRTNFK